MQVYHIRELLWKGPDSYSPNNRNSLELMSALTSGGRSGTSGGELGPRSRPESGPDLTTLHCLILRYDKVLPHATLE